MKKIFSVIFLLLVANYLQAQQSHVFKSPKAIKNSIGEFVTESNAPLPERSYQLKTFKTTDGGTATLLKFDQEESEAVAIKLQPELLLFPNPSSASVTIELKNFSSMYQVEFFNLHGRSMKSFETSGKTNIDVTQFPSGIYFIKCTFEDEVLVTRLVIEN